MGVTRPIAQQLRDAWKHSEYTLEQLREGAGLDISTDSLSRKLAGKQVLATEEAEAIAQFLQCNLVWAPEAVAS